MTVKEAIEVLKDAKYIGSDEYASDYDRRMKEAIDTVVAEVETKTYTAEEREKYGKYCAVQAYDDGFYMGYIENQRPSFDEWWSEFQRKEAQE